MTGMERILPAAVCFRIAADFRPVDESGDALSIGWAGLYDLSFEEDIPFNLAIIFRKGRQMSGMSYDVPEEHVIPWLISQERFDTKRPEPKPEDIVVAWHQKCGHYYLLPDDLCFTDWEEMVMHIAMNSEPSQKLWIFDDKMLNWHPLDLSPNL